MQDFLQGNFDDTNEAVDRFEFMSSNKGLMYFDVHQVESLFEYYLERNQVDKADQILTIGINQHPSSIPLKIKKSQILAERGEYDTALTILEQFGSIDKNSPEVLMSIGWLYLRKGYIDDALFYFDKVVENSADEAESFLLDIGYNLNQEGFYNEAIFYLTYGLLKYNQSESILFELAFAYDKTDQVEDGINIYQLLLDINPYYENAWYNLGTLYNKVGDFEKAVAAYEYSLIVNIDHAESHFNMGNSYAHLNKFAEALDCYHEFASYGLDILTTYQYIGECWEQLGNPTMAIRFYDLVIGLNSEAPDAWYGLGTSLIALAKPEEGLKSLMQALKLSPDNADFWFAYARGCFEMDKKEEAILSIEKGLSLDPEELSAWIELYQMHVEFSGEFNFISFIDAALVKYPTIGAVSYIAAVVYYKFAHDKDLALAYLKVGKRRQPEGLSIIMAEFPELLTTPEISKYVNKKVKNTK